jgi:hypothetical protein
LIPRVRRLDKLVRHRDAVVLIEMWIAPFERLSTTPPVPNTVLETALSSASMVIVTSP